VQKIAKKNYMFRHHLETTVETPKELNGVNYKLIQSEARLMDIKKVQINRLGEIVKVGE
jgi:CRISPR-associated endonuclease Csn1